MDTHSGSDGKRKTETGSSRAEPILQRQIQRLIAAVNLSEISRRTWVVIAVCLLAVTSAVAIWQVHWAVKWHQPWAVLSFAWWTHPVEFNPEAALPRVNRRLEVVALQPGENRVWIAGEAGFMAVTLNDGREWTELKYQYDGTTGDLRKSPAVEGSEASPKTGQLRLPSLVPTVFAGALAPAITISRQELSFSQSGERQTLQITNQTRQPAYINSISLEPAGVFFVESGCKEIAPGRDCALTVRFGPSSSGAYKSRLLVNVSRPEGSSMQSTALSVILTGNAPLPQSNPPNDVSQSAPAQNAAAPNAKQSNAPPPDVKQEQSKAANNPEQPAPSQPDKRGTAPATPKAAAISPAKRPVRTPPDNNVARLPSVVSPSPAPAWKPPAQLGTILAMEWTTPTSARMVTEDAVVYRTADGGDTWQAEPWDIPGVPPRGKLSVGEKDLGLASELGRLRATVLETRVPEPTRSSIGGKKITAIAKSPTSRVVWMIGRGGHDTAPSLMRSADGVRFWPATRSADEDVYWRLPAPWYWFLALPLVMLAAAAAAFAGMSDHKVQESVSNIGISDRPLEPGDPDALGINALVQGLSLFLRNESTKPPLVLAVNGDWGTGKSSLMNLLQKDLQRRGARAVWFNAWHHQEEKQLLAALLQTIRQDAVPAWWTPIGFWLRTQLLVKRARTLWLAIAILLAVAAFLVSIALDIQTAHRGLLWQYTGLWIKAVNEGTIPTWLKHAPLYTTILGVLYALNNVRKAATAFGANPASLLASLSGSGRIKDLEAQTSFRQQFAHEFHQVVEVLGSRRLLVVIDDLDRCRPEKVGEVLETVNFLISSANCFVILGLARSIVEHCVGLSFAPIVDSMPPTMLGQPADAQLSPTEKRELFAKRYLQKLVQLEVGLPQLTAEQARALLGAEPASLTADEQKRSDADRKRRQERVERRTRAALQWSFRWMLPAVFGVGLAVGLWQLGHPISRSLLALIERQVGPVVAPDKPVPGSSSAAPQPSTQPITASSVAPPPLREAVPRPAAPPAPSVGPAVESGTSAQPQGWIQSWPALLVLLWGVWFLSDAIARHAELVSKDSPRFRAALDIWSPLVMSILNTPRSAKRFLNQVRYLAMRQRALLEKDKPSMLERFCSRVGKWWVSGSSDPAAASGLTPAPVGAVGEPMPRSLGAAAATPAVMATPPKIPESLLVALAAIHLVEGGLDGLLAEKWEGHVAEKYLDLIRVAQQRHTAELKDWDCIGENIRAYRLLCSEVVTN